MSPETTQMTVTSETSDGYHTFGELYAYRKAYNALLFNEWAAQGKYDVHKSWRHSDGEPCFGGGWFIVVAQMPTGQISNHYETEDWALFKVPERERGNQWDGHTPRIALERLLALASAESSDARFTPVAEGKAIGSAEDSSSSSALTVLRQELDHATHGKWTAAEVDAIKWRAHERHAKFSSTQEAVSAALTVLREALETVLQILPGPVWNEHRVLVWSRLDIEDIRTALASSREPKEHP